MKILPELDEVKRFAASGEYAVLPVSGEILADFITPTEAFKILKNASTHAFLLESAKTGDMWGRYSFLGFAPKAEITYKNGLFSDGERTFPTENPDEELRKILKQFAAPRLSYLPPFAGGLMG